MIERRPSARFQRTSPLYSWQSTEAAPPWCTSKCGVVTPIAMRSVPPRLAFGSGAFKTADVAPEAAVATAPGAMLPLSAPTVVGIAFAAGVAAAAGAEAA